MHAVILAAGLGKRLLPVTEVVPKPLVPLNGKPIVSHTLENLPPEVTEVIFVIGYKGHMLRDTFGASVRGRPVTYVVQEEPHGTGHAVKQAAPLIHERFLLLYGDDVYGADGLQRLVRHDWALLVRRVERPERFGVVVLDGRGHVKRMIEKPTEFVSDLSWVGACVVGPEVLQVETPLSPRGEYEFPDMVNALIGRGTRFTTELADLWLPGNTHEEVAEAEGTLRSGPTPPSHSAETPRYERLRGAGPTPPGELRRATPSSRSRGGASAA